MPRPLDSQEIGRRLGAAGVAAWGVADTALPLPAAPGLPRAISFLFRLEPASLEGLDQGPNAVEYAEYLRVNERLVTVGRDLVTVLEALGHRAVRVDDDAPDGPDDPPVFASKTAATLAGLGWIGKTALLVTRRWGSAVRLGTVFTDLELETGSPIDHDSCGRCRACVDVCPAAAGRDRRWRAGMLRDDLFDAAACERHQLNYPQFDTICGICIWACPYTQRAFRPVVSAARQNESAT